MTIQSSGLSNIYVSLLLKKIGSRSDHIFEIPIFSCTAFHSDPKLGDFTLNEQAFLVIDRMSVFTSLCRIRYSLSPFALCAFSLPDDPTA